MDFLKLEFYLYSDHFTLQGKHDENIFLKAILLCMHTPIIAIKEHHQSTPMASYNEPEHHPWQQIQSPHKASLYDVRLLQLAEVSKLMAIVLFGLHFTIYISLLLAVILTQTTLMLLLQNDLPSLQYL